MDKVTALKAAADAARDLFPGAKGEKLASQISEQTNDYAASVSINGDGSSLTLSVDVQGGKTFNGTAQSTVTGSEAPNVDVLTADIDTLYADTASFSITFAAPNSSLTICIFLNADDNVLGTFVAEDEINSKTSAQGPGSWS